jgi:hypothetical protein
VTAIGTVLNDAAKAAEAVHQQIPLYKILHPQPGTRPNYVSQERPVDFQEVSKCYRLNEDPAMGAFALTASVAHMTRSKNN